MTFDYRVLRLNVDRDAFRAAAEALSDEIYSSIGAYDGRVRMVSANRKQVIGNFDWDNLEWGLLKFSAHLSYDKTVCFEFRYGEAEDD